MTTTSIITNTVNATGDGFDLAANGDTVIVAPDVLLSGEGDGASGVLSETGGYVIDDGDIFGTDGEIVLNNGGTDYSAEVWVSSQGVVESGGGHAIFMNGDGPFTI